MNIKCKLFHLVSAASLLAISGISYAATFVMEKNNTNFSIDGNGGAIRGQQVYLWETNTNNSNQKWVQYARGNGYYSYRKENTSLCLDGGDGGARRQAVTLFDCDENNQNQHWKKVKVFSGTEIYRFEKRNAPNFSIDGNGGADFKQSLYLWDSNDNNVNQQWDLIRTDDSSPTPTVPPTPGSGSGTSKIPSNITNNTIFDLEGDNPHPLADENTLVFVPLRTKFTTPNGNGWRHEFKIKQDLRVAMSDTYEHFKATVRVDMSDAGKTIIAQHHASDTGTIMKLYVSDSNESGFDDSNAGNGIFDVYVRLLNTEGNEEKYALGTIRSGDSFDVEVINDYGRVTVSALGNAFGIPVEDDSESYFKFGNYLQSQDTYESEDCGEHGDSDSFGECFKDFGITESTVTMTNVSYTRVVD